MIWADPAHVFQELQQRQVFSWSIDKHPPAARENKATKLSFNQAVFKLFSKLTVPEWFPKQAVTITNCSRSVSSSRSVSRSSDKLPPASREDKESSQQQQQQQRQMLPPRLPATTASSGAPRRDAAGGSQAGIRSGGEGWSPIQGGRRPPGRGNNDPTGSNLKAT